MDNCDSKRIDSVRVYSPTLKTGRIRWYHSVFLVLYALLGGWMIRTIGAPYRNFLIKADREGFQVMQGDTKLRAELEHSFADINDPGRRTEKLSWTAWMDMDVEELAEAKKRDKWKSVLDSLPKHMRVPHQHAPDFWPSLLFGVVATLHALVVLMQHWVVAFGVWINYKEKQADQVEIPTEWMELEVDEDELESSKVLKPGESPIPDRKIEKVPAHFPTHARISPSKEGERDVLVPLEYFPLLGMTFEFHRRRYVYDSEEGVWSKVRCRTTLPLDNLASYEGLVSTNRILFHQVRYGPNLFSVRQPSFLDLYKRQLLNPFSVFQIFCVLLWAIDDYLIYSFFSLFMVLVFEGTVVMQRLKSLQALRGMGNPSRSVHVFRCGTWRKLDTTALLPGDVVSLTRVAPKKVKDPKRPNLPPRVVDDGGDVVPADLLLLSGNTVVNEASLTGESVPQMKEGVSEYTGELSIKGTHKMNVVYAGTKMLQCRGSEDSAVGEIPPPPDNGCVCFALRTGFASAQGKLVRMIEGSQEKVKGHERETGLLLLLLCVFAIISSSYVLYHGAQDEKRSKYELLLHCILIVTSVIRPELPMQMALAVNNSLMTLMRMHIFCTEPYRVPMAGKLDACLFDKTGTLTTDELVAVGVCEPSKLGSKADDKGLLTPMSGTTGAGAFVLAGCHSLIVIDDETQGDPLESAALKSMRWEVNASGLAVPMAASDKKPAGKPIAVSGHSNVTQLRILTRHHFSSKLQRMSCVVQSRDRYFSVAKGSPEAIGRHLVSKPEGYDEQAEALAKQGYRVIALAYKELASPEAASDSRAECEADLRFAGFIAFTCRVRKDTANVLKRLKQGGMSVAMVTGDALLTAIHVAKEVAICGTTDADLGVDMPAIEEKNEELKAFLQSKREANGQSTVPSKAADYKSIAFLKEDSDKGTLAWYSYENGDHVADYVAKNLPDLSSTYDLATTGKCMAQAFEEDDQTGSYLQYIKVFARMTPDAKETVIECLHSVGALCLMCGDGANDVGALKQADVGVALLSGFGNLNVDKGEDEEKDKKENSSKTNDGLTAIMSAEALEQIRRLPVGVLKMKIRAMGVNPDNYPEIKEKEDLVKLYQIKARETAVKRHDDSLAKSKKNMTAAEKKAEQRREMQEKQIKIQQRTEELAAQGVSFASFKAMREFMNEEIASARAKNGVTRGVEGSAATLAAQLEEMDAGELPVVKLGDASIAAPFTSKMPSIKSCVDIVRQGRCTLVSSIQMYQIMALQCLISSYSLSVLYLDGVKYGDSQMTAMGLLGSVSFMSVSRSKPLDRLSPVQPLSSIFHPALFASLLGQFVVHLGTMVYAVHQAKTHLSDDYEPDLDGMFQPGILNTVVFLVSSVQQTTVFFVNLQGRPFMTGVTENRPLMWSLAATFILTFMFASETVPGLNRYFQLVPFPDESFRTFILTILALDLLVTFVWDRLMKLIFSRDILVAGWSSTSRKEVYSFLQTFGMMALVMRWVMGNSDSWDELLEMERNMTANVTDALAECVGDACETIKKVTGVTTDEF